MAEGDTIIMTASVVMVLCMGAFGVMMFKKYGKKKSQSSQTKSPDQVKPTSKIPEGMSEPSTTPKQETNVDKPKEEKV